MNHRYFESQYTGGRFWAKLLQVAKIAGIKVLEKALQLYYAAQSPDTPVWAKTVIYTALGYFISPIDAIPDMTPMVGFADDLSVLAAAIVTVAVYITPSIRRQASDKLAEWFAGIPGE